MKYFLAILALGLLLSSNAFAGEWCAGWKKGYVAGYKNAHNTVLKPIVPICPLKPLKGFGDPADDFEWGYIVGLKSGFASMKGF